MTEIIDYEPDPKNSQHVRNRHLTDLADTIVQALNETPACWEIVKDGDGFNDHVRLTPACRYSHRPPSQGERMSDDIRRKLSAELQKLDMPEAAQNALEGLYSDFDSPLAAPKVTLCETLWTAADLATRRDDMDAQDGHSRAAQTCHERRVR